LASYFERNQLQSLVPHEAKIPYKTRTPQMNVSYSGKTIAATMMLALVMLAGCKSKEDAAIEAAKRLLAGRLAG
jgi:hypothetical protein